MSDGMRPAVLLVDDEPAIRSSYSQRLSSQGLIVEAVADGFEAVQVAQQARFDLILLDVRMPSRSGADVLRLLRAAPRTSRTRVFLLAESGDAALVEACMREGADGVFQKDALAPLDVAVEVATMLGASGPTNPRLRGRENVPSAVDQIARRLGRAPAPRGTPDRHPAGRPVRVNSSPDAPRDAVDMYRRQEQLTTRSPDEVRELTSRGAGRIRHNPHTQLDPGSRGAPGHGAPRQGPPGQGGPAHAAPPRGGGASGMSFDTVLNRFVGQAGALARALGVPQDLTCPVCHSQLVLRLRPDDTGRAQVCGEFVCPGCTQT